MRRRSILWHLYPPHLLVIVLAVVALVLYVSSSMERFFLRTTEEHLVARALLAERSLGGLVLLGDEADADSVCKDLGAETGTRATVVLASGRVLCDSEGDPRTMGDHGDRPEIIQALSGRTGVSRRYSDTRRRNEMYVAVPVRGPAGVVGAMRVSMPLTAIEDRLRGMRLRILLGGAVVALLAALASLGVARRIGRPLDEIRRGMERFARNDLAYRLPSYRLHEVAELADEMNDMAGRLDERIKSEIRQRNEQEAVLASMVEGLIAVDTDERIMRINRAAAAILDVSPEAAVGRTIQEVVRNPELQRFVTKALAAGEPVEGDIALRGDAGDRYLQAHGARLRDAGDRRIGAVVVLNDITRLQRLEEVRRDFVANVSHELKTPITSIKGFIETLRDGAIHDAADAAKFLEIVAKQTDRMSLIVEDLLFLSRLEQAGARERMPLEETPLRRIALEAIEVCSRKAGEKKIAITLEASETVSARVNAPLLEQALVNLVDNAVTYSDAGTAVTVRIEDRPAGIAISVADQGPGIEAGHLERIFERFYRIDKARSRKLGGTGLGLSIVKHIAQAHGGSVTVESAPGRGSTFAIHLPKSR